MPENKIVFDPDEEEKKRKDITKNTIDDWEEIQKEIDKYPSPLYENATGFRLQKQETSDGASAQE